MTTNEIRTRVSSPEAFNSFTSPGDTCKHCGKMTHVTDYPDGVSQRWHRETRSVWCDIGLVNNRGTRAEV